ncbi:MAG: SH3 domain-containing protein [Rikenellaceae bacterium]
MRTIQIYLVAIIAIFTLSFNSAQAQSYSVPKATETLSAMSESELWDRGNTAYANDNFVDAERYYNEILQRGFYSTKLYYNLGNVHHKRGELGRSLLYYYRALELSPSDRDIQHNIEIAEAQTKDKIERIPTIFIVEWLAQIRAMMGCMGWSIVSLVMLAALLGSLLFYLLTTQWQVRRSGFFAAVVFALLFIISTRFALATREEMLNPSSAIVMSSAVSVKSSPSDSSTELFILNEGTKVKIKRTLEEWSEVVIEDGKSGWVKNKRIERI